MLSNKDGVIKVMTDNGLVLKSLLISYIPCDASTLRFSYTRGVQDRRYSSKRDKRPSMCVRERKRERKEEWEGLRVLCVSHESLLFIIDGWGINKWFTTLDLVHFLLSLCVSSSTVDHISIIRATPAITQVDVGTLLRSPTRQMYEEPRWRVL